MESKTFIKQILRESISKLTEAEEQKKEDNGSYESDYREIQNKLLGGVLKASQIMQMAGLGDHLDSTARSLFMKKLKKEKNDEGSVYKFDETELKKIKQVISNPNTVTNSSSKH